MFTVIALAIYIRSQVLSLHRKRPMHEPAFRAKAVVAVYPARASRAWISDAQIARVQHICAIDVSTGKGKECHSAGAYVTRRVILCINNGMPGRNPYMR